MNFFKIALLGGLLGSVGFGGTAFAQAPLRFEQDATSVRALAGEEPRWTFRTGEQKQGGKVAPIQVGESVVFCGDGHLYEAAVGDGQIQRRMALPGPCVALTAHPDRYDVLTEGGHDNQHWKQSFSIRPGKDEPAFLLPSGISPLLALKRQAEAVAGKTKAQQEGASERLVQQHKQDPTNPWYSLKRAEVLQEQGKTEEAKQAAEEALTLDPRYDFDLLALSSRLQKLSPELGNKAFQRGMKRLLENGYEPEQSTSLLLPVVLLGRPGDRQGDSPEAMDPVKDREALELHGERIAELAPNAEGSTWFFAALEKAAVQRGDQAQARRWAPLVHRTKGTEAFLPTGSEGRNAGVLTQLVSALAMALFAGAVIKSIRSFSMSHEEGAPWWKQFNPFSRWDRGELLGFLLAALLMTGLSYRATTGIAVIGAVAAAPSSLAMGNLGHPESRAYLAASPDGPGTRALRAFAAHKAGDLDEAERLYREVNSPGALANLGAIALARGQREQAQQLWHQARERQPALDAVAFNLNLRTEDARVHQARRYQLPVLLALPTEEDWHQFWLERVRDTVPLNPLRAPNLLDKLSSGPSSELSPVYALAVLDFVLLGLVLLALLSPRKLRPSSRAFRLAGTSLSLFAPGASSFYGFFSFFVGAAFIFLAMSSQILASTGGQSITILNSISMVDWRKLYGIAELGAELPMLHGVVRFWWVFLVFNLGVVLAFDLRRALPTSDQL